MQSIRVGKNEDGQRLDRILLKLLPLAGKGFLYKMLRKKNIVLNDKKADGNEKLALGDEIKLYLSDDTIAKFRGSENAGVASEELTAVAAVTNDKAGHKGNMVQHQNSNRAFDFAAAIIYEDDNIVLVNKPVGILSQKAQPEDYSLNEYLIDYLVGKGEITEQELITFRPSICNRLDRNTGGIVAAGKSLKGLQVLSELFRSRELGKYYLCIVKGRVENPAHLRGYLKKDSATNQVEVLEHLPSGADTKAYDRIETKFRPLKCENNCTLLEVELLTGKTHQIRAHLASIGHPIAGDHKYGEETFNRWCRDNHKVKGQLLFAYKLVFPKGNAELGLKEGQAFELKMPASFFVNKD